MDVRSQGYVRGSSGVYLPANYNEFGEQLMAQGSPSRMEPTRDGGMYATMATSAVAALVARPTTTAALEIYNNMTQASLVITRLFSHWLVQSTTALGSGSGLYAMVTLPKAAPTDAALAVTSLSGKPATTKHVLTAASTTVADNGWFPYGNSVKHESAGAVVPGGILEARLDGEIIVPPQCSLCIHVVSGYTGDTFTSGAAWQEKILALR